MSPEGDEDRRAEKTSRELAETKLTRTAKAAEGETAGSDREEDARRGLLRLTDFVRQQRRETGDADAPVDTRVLAFRGTRTNVPAPPTETEVRVDDTSHEFTRLIIEWSARKATSEMSLVVRDELERRRGLRAYRAAKAKTKTNLVAEPHTPLDTFS